MRTQGFYLSDLLVNCLQKCYKTCYTDYFDTSRNNRMIKNDYRAPWFFCVQWHSSTRCTTQLRDRPHQSDHWASQPPDSDSEDQTKTNRRHSPPIQNRLLWKRPYFLVACLHWCPLHVVWLSSSFERLACFYHDLPTLLSLICHSQAQKYVLMGYARKLGRPPT